MIASLRNVRGAVWAELVDRVSTLPENDPDSLAFTFLVLRLNSCVKCHEGSFKYMRGCQLCAAQSVMQFKGTDEELVVMYGKARRNIDAYLAGEPVEEEETEVEE